MAATAAMGIDTQEPPCRPFRIHLRADLPQPPASGTAAAKDLGTCIAYYESLDQNHNGVPDWTGHIDGRISEVVFPNDDDMDGDGLPNLFDPLPLTPASNTKAVPVLAKGAIPAHLAMTGVRGRLQSLLYRRHGVLAVDHTDHHATRALRALLMVFDKGLTSNTRRQLKSVKVVYAFLGHDPVYNIAAYHRQVKAISVGGEMSYPDEKYRAPRIALIGSIAHELGHAILFDQIKPDELGEIAARFGNWAPIVGEGHIADLVKDQRLFRSHPLKALARLAVRNPAQAKEQISRSVWRDSNLVSEYGTTNVHEWFADAFAAHVLRRLGERGLLGPRWRENLVLPLNEPEGFWVNYSNLSPEFEKWLSQRF